MDAKSRIALTRRVTLVQHLGNSSSKSGLAVVDVTDRTDVTCGLVRSNLALATMVLLGICSLNFVGSMLGTCLVC